MPTYIPGWLPQTWHELWCHKETHIFQAKPGNWLWWFEWFCKEKE